MKMKSGHVTKRIQKQPDVLDETAVLGFQSMMDHAREGAGARYEVGVNAFVNEYVGLSFQAVQVQKPDLQVKIERAYDKAAGSVKMAPQELGRALLNVLTNAFEAVSADAGTRGRRDQLCADGDRLDATQRRVCGNPHPGQWARYP